MNTKAKEFILFGILSIYCILIIISLPLGFDQHHSGLILASLNEFKFAAANGVAYPFNQYGPAWIIIFHYLLLFAPDTYFFLSVKVIGMSFVFLSLITQYKLARMFLNKLWSLLSIAWILLTYPFFTGFLPWPSLIIMPVVPYIAYVLIRFTAYKETRYAFFHLFLVGILISVSILTRAQVGITLLIVTVFFISFSKQGGKTKSFASLWSGILLSASLTASFLVSKGWLRSAVYDEFILGFKYVMGDKSTFPVPLGTIFLVCFFFVLTFTFRFIRNNSSAFQQIKISRMQSYTMSVLFFVTIILVWNEKRFNRIWISFTIFVFLLMLIRCLATLSLPDIFISNPINILVVFSGVALLQVWPLFDQMHTWWAITPFSTLIVLLFRDSLAPFDSNRLRCLIIYPSLFAVLVLQTVSVYSSYRDSSELKIPGLLGNFSSKSNVSEMNDIQNFFENSIPNKSKILNLCANGNILFAGGKYNSVSRNVVFWSTMKDDEDLFNNILLSKPDFIVTCNFTPFTSQQYDFVQLQQLIINRTMGLSRVAFELNLDQSRRIQILIKQ